MDVETKEKFDCWCIVEIMGHRKLAGRVTEETVGGTAFVRIDCPPVGEREEAYGQILPSRPAFTQYLGGTSIFSITPCSEEVARQAADRFRDYPVELVTLQPPRPQINDRRGNTNCDDDYDDDDEYRGI